MSAQELPWFVETRSRRAVVAIAIAIVVRVGSDEAAEHHDATILDEHIGADGALVGDGAVGIPRGPGQRRAFDLDLELHQRSALSNPMGGDFNYVRVLPDVRGYHSFGDEEEPWVTIVGVVGDVRYYGLDREPGHELYRPFAQQPGWGAVLVRTRVESSRVVALLRRAVREMDPEQPVDRIRPLSEVRSESVARPRITAILLGIFAVVALVITAAGIGGVLALSVSQRTVEIGVRMALGAERSAVLRMILEQGLGLVLGGLGLGLVGAIALSRLIERLLFGVPGTDPFTYVAVALLLLGVAAIACLLPARRAASVDPLVALRHA
jgi:hypothetical protein